MSGWHSWRTESPLQHAPVRLRCQAHPSTREGAAQVANKEQPPLQPVIVARARCSPSDPLFSCFWDPIASACPLLQWPSPTCWFWPASRRFSPPVYRPPALLLAAFERLTACCASPSSRWAHPCSARFPLGLLLLPIALWTPGFSIAGACGPLGCPSALPSTLFGRPASSLLSAARSLLPPTITWLGDAQAALSSLPSSSAGVAPTRLLVQPRHPPRRPQKPAPVSHPCPPAPANAGSPTGHHHNKAGGEVGTDSEKLGNQHVTAGLPAPVCLQWHCDAE